MTLETVYYLSQSIAVILLLVSIIFVGIQIRQNTRATRAASAYDVMKAWGEFNGEQASNPTSIRLMMSLSDETKTIQDFSPTEQLEMHTFVLSLVQFWSGQFFLFKEGSLPKEYWELNGRFAGNFLKLPVVRGLLERQESGWMSTPDFFREVQLIANRSPANLSSLNFQQTKVGATPSLSDD